MRIHLIERRGGFCRMAGHEWESGDWRIGQATAERLIGGNVYFHKHQSDPSYFGGTVIGYRVVAEPNPNAGRVVLRFRAEQSARGRNAKGSGWGREKKVLTDFAQAAERNETAGAN